MVKNSSLIFLILTIVAAAVGCAPVKPWQKGALAKNQMQFDPDPLEARFRRHVFESKEGSRGGNGAIGGGCGCK